MCPAPFYFMYKCINVSFSKKWWSFGVWSGAEQQIWELWWWWRWWWLMVTVFHQSKITTFCIQVTPESKACHLDWHDASVPATHRSPAHIVLQEERRISRCQQLLTTNWADVDLRTSNRRCLVCRGFGRSYGCVGHCQSQKSEDEEQRWWWGNTHKKSLICYGR